MQRTPLQIPSTQVELQHMGFEGQNLVYRDTFPKRGLLVLVERKTGGK